ncbi:hypothetical protein J2853_001363 [Streptosporangium lutulentum]|uniref:Uncharacterized protein n=1 Tax=Streptosporangium lutulentum TaxID=1461250 RepID=A0ABT9Q671_9ACTN|nr:hypothetical protein [Streptosporangium lutulentum]
MHAPIRRSPFPGRAVWCGFAWPHRDRPPQSMEQIGRATAAASQQAKQLMEPLIPGDLPY